MVTHSVFLTMEIFRKRLAKPEVMKCSIPSYLEAKISKLCSIKSMILYMTYSGKLMLP